MKTTRLDKYINPKLLDPLVNLRPTLEAKGIEVLKGETGWNQAAVTMEDPREFLGVLERKGVDTVFAGPMYWDMSHHDLELTVENINKFLECYKQEPLSPEQTALLSVDIDECRRQVQMNIFC